MSLLTIISYVVAALMAISRVADATKPFWKFLPTKVAMFIPALVAMIPFLAEKLGASTTPVDVINALLVAGAMLLPGAGVPHPDAPTPPTA